MDEPNDVINLYNRVQVGAKVIVLPQVPPAQVERLDAFDRSIDVHISRNPPCGACHVARGERAD
jgi:hypothetical protein